MNLRGAPDHPCLIVSVCRWLPGWLADWLSGDDTHLGRVSLLMWMGMMPVLVLRLGLVFRDAYLADRAQVEEGAAGMAALRAEGERRG